MISMKEHRAMHFYGKRVSTEDFCTYRIVEQPSLLANARYGCRSTQNFLTSNPAERQHERLKKAFEHMR